MAGCSVCLGARADDDSILALKGERSSVGDICRALDGRHSEVAEHLELGRVLPPLHDQLSRDNPPPTVAPLKAIDVRPPPTEFP